MNILITGATGFIGQHLMKALAADHEHSITAVSRSKSALPASIGKIIIADLSHPGFVDDLPMDIDCVVHLAQSSKYRNFPGGVDDMRQINIDATIDLLEWARTTRVKQLIFTSTANVYGKSNDAFSESHATQPLSFYGATKLAAEHLVRQYQDFFQIDILRCFTVYGPGQKNMLIPNIIARILSGRQVDLAQGVGVFLSPIYVGDVINIIGKLIAEPVANRVRLLNLCGDQAVSLKEVVQHLEEIVGKPAILHETDDIAPHFVGSNSQLRDFLGTYEFKDMRTGLQETIDK